MSNRERVLAAIFRRPNVSVADLRATMKGIPPGSISGYCTLLAASAEVTRTHDGECWRYRAPGAPPPPMKGRPAPKGRRAPKPARGELSARRRAALAERDAPAAATPPKNIAAVAQSGEHLPRKQGAAGSIPAGGTKATWSRVAELNERRELARVMAE